ncbi:MAG: hypothetical protein HOP11_00680 [Saprospiraceae bacterium]|nr:hypothetical protein [Saprospiraceae bacterium]
MKNLVLSALLIAVLFTLHSCNKETEQIATVSELTIINQNEISALETLQPEENMPTCFEYIFPVKVQIGKLEFIANNLDELNKLLSKGTTASSRPQLVFPIEVIILATAEKKTINSLQEYNALLKECGKDTRKGGPVVNNLNCFKYVFPLGVQLSDGSTIRVASQEELNKLLRATTTRGAAKLVFPFKVTLADGTEVTINNAKEYGRLLASCKKTRNG